MTDLVEALEWIAERGTHRGAGVVFAAAQRDAEARPRASRHRGLVVAAGVLLVAGLSAVAGLAALRSEPGNRVVTTPGPGGAAANRALADPTIDCVLERGGRRATTAIDPTLVPSSTSTDLDDHYRVVVSVLSGDEVGGSAAEWALRIDVYGPDLPGTQHSESLPDGVVFRTETGPKRPGDLVALSATTGTSGGVRIACDDARNRLIAATSKIDLVPQPLAIGGEVRTPPGWMRAPDATGGSDLTTTFVDPTDAMSRYVVRIEGSRRSWYELDGTPGSITPFVPADAKASLVPFGQFAWRYERPVADGRVAIGAWIVLLDSVTKQPASSLVGEITVPVAQRTLADAAVFALMVDAGFR